MNKTNSFVEKVEIILKGLPSKTEISISITDLSGTNFIGLKKEDLEIKYIDNKTIAFEIGSVTKAFTGNILAKMVDEEKIKLDDTIESFIPFRLLGNPPITFKQLALHTSGLPRMPTEYDNRADFIKENPFSNYSEENLATYLTKDLVMESTPGERANYSNLGYGLLSYIISKIENKPFSQVVEERIFRPLNMSNSSFNSKNISAHLATGLDKAGDSTSHWDGGIFEGSLGIISTAEDLAKFSKMTLNYTDKSVVLQTENTFLAKPDVKTCVGWLVVNFNTADPVIKINGGTAGFSSSIFVNQSKQKVFTFCSNIQPDSYMELIEHLCINTVL